MVKQSMRLGSAASDRYTPLAFSPGQHQAEPTFTPSALCVMATRTDFGCTSGRVDLS